MKRQIIIPVLLFMLCPLAMLAQSDSALIRWSPKQQVERDSTKLNSFTLGLDFLTMGQICAGGLPNADPNKTAGSMSAFLQGRLRFNIGYERPYLQMKAVVQNGATWGAESNMSVSMYEAWAKVHGKGLFAQLGRVALSYDDERIIGPNDFAMAASSHDVLRLGYEGKGHKIHLIGAYNQVDKNIYRSTYYSGGSQYYKTMQVLWYHYDAPIKAFPFGFSILGMNVGMQAGRDGVTTGSYRERIEWQQLVGGYWKATPKYTTIEAAYYHQLGRTQYGVKINAFMASILVDIHPNDRYGFTVGYDFLSGDDYMPVPKPGDDGMPYHDVMRGFAPLYGSKTKFYGILDYFYESAYLFGFTPGLQNAYFTAYGTPYKGLSVKASYHYLATATKLDKLEYTLGHSGEVTIGYKFFDWLSLTGSYTLMYGTETMNQLKQGNNNQFAHWGWLSLSINPEILEIEWFDKKRK